MAGGSGAEENNDLNVATWRIVLFFLVILIVDTAWEYIDHIITARIRLRKSKGMLHAWEQLKFEVMALGLVSLLLVVTEARPGLVVASLCNTFVTADVCSARRAALHARGPARRAVSA